jgi:hypothetical protein
MEGRTNTGQYIDRISLELSIGGKDLCVEW